jgi:hypothetical protein
MSEKFVINDFTDIVQHNRTIIQKIRQSDDVMEIAELVSKSEEIRDFAHEYCNKKSFYGTSYLCKTMANRFYKDVIKVASYKINMLKKREERQRIREAIFDTGI